MDIIKQKVGEPYYKDMLWNKPETKALAGKILVIGGNKFGISSPSEAYASAIKHGAGEAKAVLPDSTKKLFGGMAPSDIQFAKSAPGGSFSKGSIAEMLSFVDWADLVLLAGDFSRSSETGILLEELLAKSSKNFVITRDSLDYFTKNGSNLLYRPNTTLVASFAQLQSLLASAKYSQALKFSMPNNLLINYLQDVSRQFKANIITARQNYIYVLAGQKLSVTDYQKDIQSWRLETAVKSSVWLMQNPQKFFEALTTACAT